MKVLSCAAVLLTAPASAAPVDVGRMTAIRAECATEIGLLCAQKNDIPGCLEEHRADLTPWCRDALGRDARPRAGARRSSDRHEAKPPPASPPAGAVAVPGIGNVWFEGRYSGPRQELYRKFLSVLLAEIPHALEEVSGLIGQPDYRSSFPRPLVLRVEYDATQKNGLAYLDGSGRQVPGLSVVFNLAHWEDCPSRPMLRSIVTHEFTHAALHDYVGEGEMTFVPQWFDEGLATLAGGEPYQSIALDSAYARHGKEYPGPLPCRFTNDGFGLGGVGLATDCYPFYLLAAQTLAESSPGALPKIIADMRSGIPIENSIPARTGLAWGVFAESAVERTRQVMKGKTMLSRLTGRGWWRDLRWCRK